MSPLSPGRFPSVGVALLAVLATVFVPMLALFLKTNEDQRGQAVDSARQGALAAVDQAASEQDERIESAKTLLTGLKELPLFDPSEHERCERLFRRILRSAPRYANLGAIDNEGRVTCSGVRQRGRTDVSDQAFYERAIAARGFGLGDYLVGPITHLPVVVVALAIRRADGTPRGVLTAPLDLAWLNAVPRRTRLPAGSVLAMVDTNGTILLRSSQSERFVGRKASPEALRELAARPRGSFTLRGLDGVERLYVFRRLPSAGGSRITVLAGIPSAAIFAEADRIQRRNLIALGAAFLVALLLCTLLARRLIVRPVRRLGDTARRLAAGDLAARTGLDRQRGELGALATAFDATAAALEARDRDSRETAARAAQLAEQRRLLVTEALDAEDRERTRLSEALHDDTLQVLLAARHELVDADRGDTEALHHAQAHVDQARRSLRGLMTELSPVALQFSTLSETVHSVVHAHAERRSIDVHVDLDESASSAHNRLVVRAAGELISNVVKHARASEVLVTLHELDGQVELCLKDNGVGFTPDLELAVHGGHIGLASLKSRVEAIGGSLELATPPGGGSQACLRVPR